MLENPFEVPKILHRLHSQPITTLTPSTTQVIGFISFIFTLATALRVFWSNLRTIGAADSEVAVVLPNLKQNLYEERSHLRCIRRRCHGIYQEGAFHVLYIGVRSMIQEFKRLEAPFRDDEDDDGRYNPRKRAGRRGSARFEKDRRLENGDGDEKDGTEDDYYMSTYSAKSLKRRWLWLYRRSAVLAMTERLSRVQTRRIARQTTDIAVYESVDIVEIDG